MVPFDVPIVFATATSSADWLANINEYAEFYYYPALAESSLVMILVITAFAFLRIKTKNLYKTLVTSSMLHWMHKLRKASGARHTEQYALPDNKLAWPQLRSRLRTHVQVIDKEDPLWTGFVKLHSNLDEARCQEKFQKAIDLRLARMNYEDDIASNITGDLKLIHLLWGVTLISAWLSPALSRTLGTPLLILNGILTLSSLIATTWFVIRCLNSKDTWH